MKKFENFTTLNMSDLNNTWSAEYHVNKKKGLFPYVRKNDIFTEINPKYKTIPRDVIYLTPSEAEELNSIGKELSKLKIRQNEILNKK